MEYIFEDQEHKGIPSLFRMAFSSEAIKHFHYADGAGNLKNKARACLNQGADGVAIFIDLVFDNEATWATYSSLNKAAIEEKVFRGKTIIIPIPCIEYYYIKSLYLYNKPLIVHLESIEKCLSFQDYTSDILHSKKCNTHEKFCKSVVKYAFNRCVRDESNQIPSFLSEDCLCDKSEAKCKEQSLIEKSMNLVRCMQIIPCGSILEANEKAGVSFDEAIEISRSLYSEFEQRRGGYV